MAQTQTKQQAHAGIDAICAEALGRLGRKRLAGAYEDFDRKLEANPAARAEREAGARAREAIQASLAAGEPPEVAQERAKKASGRTELRFDFTERAEELRREAFTQQGFVVTPVNGHPPGAARAADRSPRESSGRTNSHVHGSRRAAPARTTESAGDDPPSSGPPERRCRDPRCGRIFSTQDGRRHYCDECSAKGNPLHQQVRRGSLADGIDPGDYEILGHPAELKALRKRAAAGCSGHPPLLLDGTGHCSKCGHDVAPGKDAQPGKDGVHARTVISTQHKVAPGRKKRRRKRNPVTKTFDASIVRKGVVAA